mgnify:CR=1 FL=1
MADPGKKKKGRDDRGRDAHIYDEAIRFIEQQRRGPFYVNVWGHISHNPVNPVDALVNRWSNLSVRDSDFPEPMRRKLAAVQAAGGDVDDPLFKDAASFDQIEEGGPLREQAVHRRVERRGRGGGHERTFAGADVDDRGVERQPRVGERPVGIVVTSPAGDQCLDDDGEHLEARHARHLVVEHHEVEVLLERVLCRHYARNTLHCKTVVSQKLRQFETQERVILYQE